MRYFIRKKSYILARRCVVYGFIFFCVALYFFHTPPLAFFECVYTPPRRPGKDGGCLVHRQHRAGPRRGRARRSAALYTLQYIR